ncbi:MAG: hypothetical protein QXH35_09050 [Nitrososphaerota archaeon]
MKEDIEILGVIVSSFAGKLYGPYSRCTAMLRTAGLAPSGWPVIETPVTCLWVGARVASHRKTPKRRPKPIRIVES